MANSWASRSDFECPADWTDVQAALATAGFEELGPREVVAARMRGWLAGAIRRLPLTGLWRLS